MKCVICKHGETRPGRTTVTPDAEATTWWSRVSANICANCGEDYVDEPTTARLIKTMDEAAHAGVEVDVREYVAA